MLTVPPDTGVTQLRAARALASSSWPGEALWNHAGETREENKQTNPQAGLAQFKNK